MSVRTAAYRPCAILAVAAAGALLALGTPAIAGAHGQAAPAANPTGGSAPSAILAPAAPPALPPVGPAVDSPTLMIGGAVSMRTRPQALLGETLSFSGATPRGDAHSSVLIQTSSPSEPGWRTVTGAHVDSNGGFVANWHTNETGQLTVRAVTATQNRRGHRPAAHRARAADTSLLGQISVFEPALATYFGPGFYGRKTACGEMMSRALLGVANRTLRCGTEIEIDYRGRRLVVPVVDRGPYANGADWDLTTATAAALNMRETERIGTIVLGAAQLAGGATAAP